MVASQVFELFPTPVMRVAGVVDAAAAENLRARLAASTPVDNTRSAELSHSRILAPGDEPLLDALAGRIGPHVAEFGALLFGAALPWHIKEMWLNVMRPGGSQGVHNHANCFASGIVYLSECDDSANTVFLRGLGGRDFVFAHSGAGSTQGPFNAARWLGPAPSAGDLLLFPSYLLHEVPVNRGGERTTLAFNAIPERLDAHGYTLSFSS